MPFKTKLPMRALQLIAMKRLLNYYNNGDEQELGYCPLCMVKDKRSGKELPCEECVWTIETGKECWEHPLEKYGPNQQTMSVGMCRDRKPRKWVTRRVRELTAWIKTHSERL